MFEFLTEELEINFANMIEEKSILVTDNKTAYIKFAKNHNFEARKFLAPGHFHKKAVLFSEHNFYQPQKQFQEAVGLQKQLCANFFRP